MNDYVDPDWENTALLTIDTQWDFTLPGAPAEIQGTAEVVSGMQRLARVFRRRNRPIVHVVRLYRPDGSNVDLCRKQGVQRGKRVVLPGTDGAELVDELKPSPEVRLDAEKPLGGGLQPIGPAEWIMYKPRWGLSTELR